MLKLNPTADGDGFGCVASPGHVPHRGLLETTDPANLLDHLWLGFAMRVGCLRCVSQSSPRFLEFGGVESWSGVEGGLLAGVELRKFLVGEVAEAAGAYQG